MQFCFGVFNNVLYVFLLKFALFLKYYVCKKPVFIVTSALKIQQNIDLSQHVTLKNVDFSWKPLKLLISSHRAITKTLLSPKLQSNVNLTRFHINAWQQGSWFHLKNEQTVHFTQCISSETLISGVDRLKCRFHINAWQQSCWFHLNKSKMFVSRSAQAQKRQFQA